ncbi:WD40-repeat-containing domain protein [Lentinula detonsa]|uniref:WD40-repeat-containing domain protein n=1 Tax=Lentinula detonsa TaxID=2804962 RepID=A0AA38Q160_9AGAR|nr:WD40-repeat-containing domain protein [Lentinula detonsa]
MDGHFNAWSPPQYDLSHPPALDVTLTLTDDLKFPQNFARITKWCPDGSVYLSQCEDRSFQLGRPELMVPNDSNSNPQLTLQSRQPAPIVDFEWYPTATSKDPATFCFVSSVRECPVKLLDASDGRLRASYPIIDHRERFIAPHSLAFNLTARKLYCGFQNAIEVFDTANPGEGIRLATTPNKSSKDGLKGIISALAFCPSYESDVFAAGSLNANQCNIALFSESQGQTPLMFLNGGVSAGVMQLQFNSNKPHMLYASFRRDTRIFCWDIRYNSDQPLKVYASNLTPPASLSKAQVQTDSSSFKESTNQKHRFDVDITGKYLSVGRQDGNIMMYDLDNAFSALPELQGEYTEPTMIPPTLVFPGHEDSIGSVAFHPTSSRLLSSSGSRNFDDDESDSDSDADGSATSVSVHRRRRQPSVRDHSLKLWRF